MPIQMKVYSPKIFVWTAFLAVLAPISSYGATAYVAPHVEAIRYWSFGDVTRIAVQTAGGYRISHDQIDRPARAYFDLTGLRPPSTAHRGSETISVHDKRLRQIRLMPLNGAATRIVFDLESPADIVWSQLVNPDRLMIEIRPKETQLPHYALARNVVSSRPAEIVPATPSKLPPSVSQTVEQPKTMVVAKNLPRAVVPVTPAPAPVTTTNPTPLPPPPVIKTNPAPTVSQSGVSAPVTLGSNGDASLVRVFGLKMAKVVIDAGHGGHDTGTIGPGGMLEKELVLDVALRLGALITQQLGAQVVYTRSDDTFIPLEERTHIANEQKADLFISIHANSSPQPQATGVETYYFNFTSDKSSLDLATRENSMSSSSISDLSDLLHRAVLQTKLEESREFAQCVQSSLWPMSARMDVQAKNRGVRQAPFVVLIGATMPSILAEVGFVSNPRDERMMRRNDQRQKIAEALFKGVSAYASSLSHVQIARANVH